MPWELGSGISSRHLLALGTNSLLSRVSERLNSGDMEHIGEATKKTAAAVRSDTSFRAQDGAIGELIYDRDARRTTFAVYTNGEVGTQDEVVLSGIKTVPYSPHNTILANGIVLFPKEATECGSDAQLVEEVRDFIHRYVDLEPGYERIAAHYVLLSWIYDAFNELPYLRLRGDPGTGKTRFLTTIGSICYKAMLVSGASSVSPVFRMLDAFRGTLVIDESDFRFSDEKAEFTKILNNGNGRGFPVLRCEMSASTKEFNPRAYAVYGPKVIATRGPFEDHALESRCITHDTTSAKLREDIPLNLPASFDAEALALRNKLLVYRFRNLDKPRDLSVKVDRSLEPRLNQVFAPLLSVVDDPQTLEDLKAVMRGYDRAIAADRGLDVEGAVLEVVRNLAIPGSPSPSVQEITHAFIAKHGSMYPRMKPKGMGHILRKKLGITTTKVHGAFVIAPADYSKLEKLYERYGVAAPAGERIASLFDVPEVPDEAGIQPQQGLEF